MLMKGVPPRRRRQPIARIITVAEAEREPSARADRSRRYLEAKPDALTSAGENF
jgi:hypothetical protein